MADPISTIKSISEVIKKYNDIDLMHQIVELQTEVFDLQKEVLALRKQLEDRTKMQMKGPHGYFFQDGDDVPFCPRCWENDGKAIHLPNPADYFVGRGRICRVCKSQYTEVPSQRQPNRIPPRGGSWS
jgi:hypothetical protein